MTAIATLEEDLRLMDNPLSIPTSAQWTLLHAKHIKRVRGVGTWNNDYKHENADEVVDAVPV